MTFTVNSLTRCGGTHHWTVNVTVSGGPTLDIQTTPEEMAFDPATNRDQTVRLGLERLRSAAKEASAATFAQTQTALVGKTFAV